MSDPFAVLAELKAELQAEREPQVGDIWWLPKRYVGKLKQPPDDAFCLLVAVERDRNGEPARFHYVAGSTKHGGKPRIIVEASVGGLLKLTYFRFYASRDLDPATIKADGTWRDVLPAKRRGEIDEAILDSKLVALKRAAGHE